MTNLKTNKKLELEFNFYLRSAVKIKITELSKSFEHVGFNNKLYINPDGFQIVTGYTFTFNKSKLTIPTYMPFIHCDENEITSYYIYSDEVDRYNSLNRLYKSLQKLSQSRIFQYDNEGYVEIIGNKWVLY
jgi:hypothetical protein